MNVMVLRDCLSCQFSGLARLESDIHGHHFLGRITWHIKLSPNVLSKSECFEIITPFPTTFVVVVDFVPLRNVTS